MKETNELNIGDSVMIFCPYAVPKRTDNSLVFWSESMNNYIGYIAVIVADTVSDALWTCDAEMKERFFFLNIDGTDHIWATEWLRKI
jgi:hypothetical protein